MFSPKVKKRVVAREIFDGAGLAFVHADLLHAGIALDVEDALALAHVVVEFLGAADVEDGVGGAVEIEQLFAREPVAGIARQVARTKGPAVHETELCGEPRECFERVRVVVVDLVSRRVVGQPRRVLHVPNLMPEPQQPDDVMHMLPDHARDGHTGHEAHDDDAFSIHWPSSTAGPPRGGKQIRLG